MEYLVTAEQMKACDGATIRRFGVPSMVLMERAALSCVEVLLERMDSGGRGDSGGGQKRHIAGRRTLIVAGCGNNGGDGFAIGRLLMQKGFPVDFVLVGKREKCSEETARQIAILEKYGRQIEERLPDREYDILVDALFGIGLHSALEGIYAEAVAYMNRQRAYVLSVDIPSGIHADTGAVCGCAVQADVTVTFAFRKLGLVCYPGAACAGEVICRDIGITQESFGERLPECFTFTGPPGLLLPERKATGNKGTFGKVLLAAGSRGMAGAAILSGTAVLRSGAGMVRIHTAEANRTVLQTALPEAMVTCYGEDDGEAFPEAVSAWADVIAAGPGLGTDRMAERILAAILECPGKPLVLDADAINLLAQVPALLEKLIRLQREEETRRELILTPHPGELGRLAGCSAGEAAQNAFSLCREWAQKLHAAFLCKGARTVAAAPDGRIYVNCSGNSGMATAGSGDVLTGILAGLTAQGMEAFPAACASVYLHGCAGDRAAALRGEYSMTARDLTEALGDLMRRCDFPPRCR